MTTMTMVTTTTSTNTTTTTNQTHDLVTNHGLSSTLSSRKMSSLSQNKYMRNLQRYFPFSFLSLSVSSL